MRVAIITPYYNEDKITLERCLNSVKSQTIEADHILMSDGYPQKWLDSQQIRHIKLDCSHQDYGNTPRGIGAQLAVSEEYDAIGFLDADNWLDSDHIDACIKAAEGTYGKYINCDYVVTQRRLIRPDLSIMNWSEEPDHIDTNCFFFLPGSFSLIPYWNLMPREFSMIGDRIFYKKALAANLLSAKTNKVTVNYLNLWKSTYVAIGETPPANAKPAVVSSKAFEWFARQTPREQEVIQRRLGLNIKVKSN